MPTHDGSWSAGTASLGPLVSLLLPFLRAISRRYRIQANTYFCELLERRRQAAELLDSPDTERYPALRNRLQGLVRDIDRELGGLEWNDESFRAFILLAAIELVLFSGAIFAGLWDIRAVVVARSYESGIPFFEGIFQPVAPRVGLFMLIVLAAAVTISKLTRQVERRVGDPLGRIVAYLALFNGLLLVFGVAVFEFLVLTDPISPYW